MCKPLIILQEWNLLQLRDWQQRWRLFWWTCVASGSDHGPEALLKPPFPWLSGGLASSSTTQARRTHRGRSTYSGLLQVSFSLPSCPENPLPPDTTLPWPDHRCFTLGHARLYVGTPGTALGWHLHPDLVLRQQRCKRTSWIPSAQEWLCLLFLRRLL